MDYKKIAILVAACIGSVALVTSCSDEDDSYAYSNSMLGTLQFALPDFVAVGDVYTLVPEGLTRTAIDKTYDDLGYTFGYSWEIDLLSDTPDTTKLETDLGVDGRYVLEIPDTLSTITVTCNAFAGGYYAQSLSKSAVITDPTKDTGSLVGRDITSLPQSFTDSRDSKEYY